MAAHPFPFAPDDDERALWSAFRENGSAAARARLFSLHAGYARGIARRMYREKSRGDIDVKDLQQLAYAGLLEALDRFDPSRGVPFRAFAAHRVAGSIRDGIARMSEMREQIGWRHRAQRERMASLSEASDDAVGTQEALERLTDIAVGLALGFMLEGTGLFVDDGSGEGGAAPSTAYDSVAWKELVMLLHAELAQLPERERDILHEHYMNGVNFDQIAAIYALTKGRISQLHRAALELLRRRLRERGHFKLGS